MPWLPTCNHTPCLLVFLVIGRVLHGQTDWAITDMLSPLAPWWSWGVFRLPSAFSTQGRCRVLSLSTTGPVLFRFGGTHWVGCGHALGLLLEEGIEISLEIEVGRHWVLVHCVIVSRCTQHRSLGGDGRTHALSWWTRWRQRAASSWRRPPSPCLLTPACARTRAAPRRPSARS